MAVACKGFVVLCTDYLLAVGLSRGLWAWDGMGWDWIGLDWIGTEADHCT
jgi:hypothetical protein